VQIQQPKENYMHKLRHRLQREEGFTLIELLVVIVIIGVLLAIAVPSYLGFKDRAEQKAASADVRSAIPAAEAYYADNGNYGGMTEAILQSTYDQGVDLDNVVVTTDTTADDTYCLDKDVNGKEARVTRGKGILLEGKVEEGALC
jgi:type IV pilus assembly protein PilA